MGKDKKLKIALFILRATTFIVFFVWTLDKIVRPMHAAKVFEHFYFFPHMGDGFYQFLGILQMVFIFAFLAGIKKRVTYGALLLFHAISTFSSYKQYLSPFEGTNLLFFAAWPMLGACIVLYLLRDDDTFFSLNK